MNKEPAIGHRNALRAAHRRWAQFLAVALIVGAVTGFAAQTSASEQSRAQAQQTSASDEIRHVIQRYAESINKADTDLASKVWLNSPDVSFVHPLGHEHGFDQIKQNVYGHLMGETFSERNLTPHDIAVHVHGDSAWAEFYWDFNAKFKKDGSPITTHGRETQVYWKTQDGWRLVHVHYSGMPVKQGGF